MKENGMNLYTRPRYRVNGSWFNTFAQAIQSAPSLTLDESAIMSILAFNYPCGDRTIFKEITRQPWLSLVNSNGECIFPTIPPHGRYWDSSSNIAAKLKNLLLEEIKKMCEKKKNIFVLLSGGLDSRILAGLLGLLYKSGRLSTKPVCVTWGISESRDVYYASLTAKVLGFNWEHVELNEKHVYENVIQGAPLIGCLVSPIHLHRALWFRNFGKDTAVLAASWGDSIGRAEYSGRHVLELKKPKAYNPFNLLNPAFVPQAMAGIDEDFCCLRNRSPQIQEYAIREHEMQSFYMRGMIGQALSVIDDFANLYQVFTTPEVYSFMWSLHPARRDNSIYVELLEDISSALARLPWARTNRSLRGKTIGIKPGLKNDFHCYREWISGSLFKKMFDYTDPRWFGSMGIFNCSSIEQLTRNIGANHYGKLDSFHPYNIWVWLGAFRNFFDTLKKIDKNVKSGEKTGTSILSKEQLCLEPQCNKLAGLFSKVEFLSKIIEKIKKIHLFILKRKAILKFPPDGNPKS